MSKQQTTIRIVVIVGIALLLSTCCIWNLRSSIGISATTEGAAVSNLPSDARNIRWFIRGAFGPNTVYEFDTSETGYKQWVKNRGRPKLIGPAFGAYRIMVYNHASKSFDYREIDNAIAYTWSEEDSGVSMVYDQDTGLAYFRSHTR